MSCLYGQLILMKVIVEFADTIITDCGLKQ